MAENNKTDKNKNNNDVILLETVLALLIDNWNSYKSPDDAMQKSINDIRHMIMDRKKS